MRHVPLFQRAPRTDEEIHENRPLELPPEEVGKLDEEAWRERVYRGDGALQLTVRAVGMGCVLGFFLAFTHVYLGLKTGMHLGVALAACVLSYTIWTFLHRIGLARTPMTILENNCMQSSASAAGFATGGTLISAIPAMLLLTVTPDNPGGKGLPWAVVVAWVFFLSLLGTSLAVPMKRNMINQERLKFPSGTAAAALLRSLHTRGADAVAKARALLYAALGAGVIPLLNSLGILHAPPGAKAPREALLPGAVAVFDWLPRISGAAPSAWNLKLDYSPALLAAGAIVGLRVTVSMILGGLVTVLFLGPAALHASWTDPAGVVVNAAKSPTTAWKDIGIWVGAPILVSSGLLSFAFQWRTIARAFQGLRRGASEGARAPAMEVPTSWFVAGTLLAGAGIIGLSSRSFGIPVPFGILAVLLAFVLSLVACRSTGETDIMPSGALGKITQLTYGVLMQQNVSANLMTAGITAGASTASAELLTDLKAGHLLGASPRRQYVAQLMGILPGTIATVLCYAILVPDAIALTGDAGRAAAFPAPAAQQWMAVAKVFQSGLAGMHPMARQGIVVGLIAGAALTLLERALPKYKKTLPSATGIGLGLILPFHQVLAMFAGALVAAAASRKKGSFAEEMVVPVASGLIVGESIVGVAVVAANNFLLR